jgi:hypothetical protein
VKRPAPSSSSTNRDRILPRDRRAGPDSDKGHEADNEKVGYGRPPRAYQFKPGQSGNPSGRRKGTKSEATILREILSRKITIRQGDKARRVPLLEAVLLKITEGALHGDLKATVLLLNRVAAIQSDETATSDLSPDETEVMKAYAERLLKQAKDQE